jgi:hypothetical protein
MDRSPYLAAALFAASLIAGGCGFDRSSTVLGPTPTPSKTPDTTASGGTSSGTTTGATSTGTSLVGTWTSPTSTTPTPTSCTDFKYVIATQTATTILGTFTATCGSGLTLAGNVSGVLDSSGKVALTATGTANLPGAPNCAFTLNGIGELIDNGYTLTIPFTGTTCQGPVSGTQVLHKPQPAARVVFDAPAPVAPGVNAFVSTLRPKFIVTNATRTGPVGEVSYQIEVATDITFSNVYATWTVAEQSSQTSFDMPKDLSWSKVYFWHVRASDPTTPGPWSTTMAIQVTDPPAPPPPVNTGGQDAIDLHQATITGGSPGDVADWPVTAKLTALDFASSGVSVQFTKRDGPGRWPDVIPPGWTGGIEYTLWMVVNVNGHWYTSGGVEYWNGLGRSGGPPSLFTSNWYYSPAVWGPLATHQPTPGEMVGFFVTAGDARAKDVRAVTERSNVVLVPFPSDGGAYYPF